MSLFLSLAGASSSVHISKALLVLIVIQWIVFAKLSKRPTSATLIERRHGASGVQTTVFEPAKVQAKVTQVDNECKSFAPISEVMNQESEPEIDGVAFMILKKRPYWFFKRYNALLDSALATVPNTWAIQLFVNQDWFENTLLPNQYGVRRHVLDNPRVIVKDLPPRLQNNKPGPITEDRWIWDNIVNATTATTETTDYFPVVHFHGGGSFCANSKMSYADLRNARIDFIGPPSTTFGGMGGLGGGYFYQNRYAALAVYDYSKRSHLSSDDHIRIMLDMTRKGIANFTIATPEQTFAFGGTSNLDSAEGRLLTNLTDWGPMVVEGVQYDISREAREHIWKVCPESKNFYPGVTRTACVGDHVDPISCARAYNILPVNCSSGSEASLP
uniref:Uncharacterized protein n=1 Tax=Phaeodactylum tricornutum TaxID=2850 RepID=A0A8J9X6U6_PHATR